MSDRDARHRVLVDAALSLGAHHDEHAILRALPELLSLAVAFEHASVLIPSDEEGLVVLASSTPDAPPGWRVPPASITGRARDTGRPVHVLDTMLDASYVALGATGQARSEYAAPVRLDSEVVAVVNVERAEPGGFRSEERDTVDALVEIAMAHLDRVRAGAFARRERREADLLGRLASEMNVFVEPHEAARAALRYAVEHLGLDGGAVYTLRRGRFVAIALTDGLPDDLVRVAVEGIPWTRERLRRVWTSGEPALTEAYERTASDGAYRDLGLGGLAFVPVQGETGSTIALIEGGVLGRERRWTDNDRRVLERIASVLAGGLSRMSEHAHTLDLLDVVRSMARADSADTLYRHVVEAALDLHPAAEAASLLVRDEQGRFRYRASVGFDLPALQEIGPVSYANQLVWYGGSDEDFRSGRPRIARGDALRERIDEVRKRLFDTAWQAGPARVSDIAAHLLTPVALGGDVVAVLNVDAFACDVAFDAGSLPWAEALGQHAAAIVLLAHERDALARSVVTDSLTGAGNRDGFTRTLHAEFERASRYGTPFSVAVIDLDGFKLLNDSLGHDAGDRALVQVAASLRRVSRDHDRVFRWGGDEFAVILPMAGVDEAHAAVERFGRAIEEVEAAGMSLGASIGTASFPRDGDDPTHLVKVADERMYDAKRVRAERRR